MTSKKVFRSTLAAVSAATMTILATPGVALALDTEGEATPAAVTADQEKGQSGQSADLTAMPNKAKLHVHKFTPASKPGPKADGSQIADTARDLPDAKPIGGVTFTAYKVEGVDLTTNEGWRIANTLVNNWNSKSVADKETATALNDGTKDYTINKTAAAWTGTTGNDGTVVSPELPAGLYVVVETINGKKVTVGNEEAAAGSIVRSAPFVVALPLTNPTDRTEWMENVHVYPKNSQAGVHKAVNDAATRGLGNTTDKALSTVEYTIKGDIPAGYEGPSSTSTTAKKFRNFQLVDMFNDKVNYTGGDVVKLVSGNTDQELVKGTDYNITTDPSNATADGSTNIPRVLVTLTKTGLDKMAEFAKANKTTPQLVWTLNALLPASVDPVDLPNEAGVIPDYPNGSNSPWDVTTPVPDIPKAKVVSKYGKVKILKSDSNNGDKLEGVKFKLWVCDANAKKVNLDGSDPGSTTPPSVTVNNVSEWTTNSDGVVEITGLRLNNWKNDSDEKTGLIQDVSKQDYYCLEETEAKKGYEKLPKMIQFQLLTTDKSYTKILEVKNVPSNGGFDLPLTGGNGVWPLIGLGGLLVAGSAGYAAWASRRKTAHVQ